MTYQETLDYMYAQLPMYHRIGAAAYKADLQPTLDMMQALGHPERTFCSIHVSGTNGKGSVSHFLASILQEAGYKVGLYTSPHLVDFRERIRIDGQMIPQGEVVDFMEKHRAMMERIGLSFFEMTVGLAFDYFSRQQVDIAVIEVGMGGRLDSTNVITPLLSVITNIGFDHTQFLGDTLDKIALEKAGIIKPGIPVVIGESHAATRPVFQRVAEERQAPITFADEHYRIDNVEDYTTELTGAYQRRNLATVLQAVDILGKHSKFKIQHSALQRGLARVVTNTHLRGRWEKIGDRPLTICETAHNADGIEAMMQSLAKVDFRQLHIIYGCVNDKDFRKILALLDSKIKIQNSKSIWRFSQPSVPRRLPVAELQAAAREMGIEGEAFPSVREAIADARAAAHPDDLVLVTGSIFLIADALA
ncbi:MAG: bifunctional folylpolyglutamate synthase/dihydrofolate synthase [Bacteroidales bacterium]|nr:bifunctional folylpolyglutamate synthase/dihydrofolate synthase [Bacteroidales bacterium]